MVRKRKPLSPFVRKAQAYYRLAAKAHHANQSQAHDVYHAQAELMMRYANTEKAAQEKETKQKDKDPCGLNSSPQVR